MRVKPSKIEFGILMISIMIISAGYSGLYLKLFKMMPPAPTVVAEAPFYLLMALAAIYRLRETVFGLFAALPMVLLAILAVLSYKWSFAPAETLKEGVLFIILAGYLPSAAFVFDWRKIVDAIWYVLTGMVVLSFILYVGMPDIARESEIHVGAITGLWMEKNAAGQIGVFGAITALARAVINPKSLFVSGMSYLLFAAFVIASTSSTSLMGLLLATGLFVWVFMLRRNRAVAVVTLGATILVGAPLAYALSFESEWILGLLGKSSTFTGRSEVWEAVQYSISDHQLLGHGYNAFWSDAYNFGTRYYIFRALAYEVSHAHNSWLEMALNLGYVGAFLLTVTVALTVLFSLSKIRTSRGAYFAVPYVFAATLIGSFESILAVPNSLGGGLMILVMAKMVRATPIADARSGLWELWQFLKQQDRVRPVYT